MIEQNSSRRSSNSSSRFSRVQRRLSSGVVSTSCILSPEFISRLQSSQLDEHQSTFVPRKLSLDYDEEYFSHHRKKSNLGIYNEMRPNGDEKRDRVSMDMGTIFDDGDMIMKLETSLRSKSLEVIQLRQMVQELQASVWYHSFDALLEEKSKTAEKRISALSNTVDVLNVKLNDAEAWTEQVKREYDRKIAELQQEMLLQKHRYPQPASQLQDFPRISQVTTSLNQDITEKTRPFSETRLKQILNSVNTAASVIQTNAMLLLEIRDLTVALEQANDNIAVMDRQLQKSLYMLYHENESFLSFANKTSSTITEFSNQVSKNLPEEVSQRHVSGALHSKGSPQSSEHHTDPLPVLSSQRRIMRVEDVGASIHNLKENFKIIKGHLASSSAPNSDLVDDADIPQSHNMTANLSLQSSAESLDDHIIPTSILEHGNATETVSEAPVSTADEIIDAPLSKILTDDLRETHSEVQSGELSTCDISPVLFASDIVTSKDMQQLAASEFRTSMEIPSPGQVNQPFQYSHESCLKNEELFLLAEGYFEAKPTSVSPSTFEQLVCQSTQSEVFDESSRPHVNLHLGSPTNLQSPKIFDYSTESAPFKNLEKSDSPRLSISDFQKQLDTNSNACFAIHRQIPTPTITRLRRTVKVKSPTVIQEPLKTSRANKLPFGEELIREVIRREAARIEEAARSREISSKAQQTRHLSRRLAFLVLSAILFAVFHFCCERFCPSFNIC
uniref:Uncharacterized protein n=1 Tax=Spongospora subterranea TaxID=70186 RepID=A0A0H5QT25_9EUKA|eukprot:CRZ04837.1 hypothetical protein [Spongospora subterranea]